MIEKLPPREREVFEALYGRGESTAAALGQAMANPPSNAALRIMLGRLEKKGFVSHRVDGQTFIYSIATHPATIRKTAVRRFVDTFFGGSPAGAAAALLGMADRVDADELDALEQAVAKARTEQSK